MFFISVFARYPVDREIISRVTTLRYKLASQARSGRRFPRIVVQIDKTHLALPFGYPLHPQHTL